ncbi:MAG TPA: alpha/beta fold hydrolase [Candidatus Limnocylindria bacterium]|nr:alpha/beta fold hydrolase [Candidatus Limnocylindria bacterium]
MRFRWFAIHRILPALGILTMAAGAVRAGTEPERPTLVIPEARIAASEHLSWTVPVHILNTTGAGLYVDSVRCEIEDLDAGQTRAARKHTVRLSMGTRTLTSISSGDTSVSIYQFAATAERARLTFHVHAHSAAGKNWAISASTEAAPGPLSLAHPSSFVESGGRKVEVVLVRAETESAPAPGVLLVHGHSSHARSLLGLGERLAAQGFHVMLVSQPGYGLSEGTADLMGPATTRALEAALNQLRHSPGVDSTRIGVWGISRGATAVTLLAARRNDVRSVVSQAGIYDLWATYRGTGLPNFQETIVNEAGRDSAAWKERSPVKMTASLGRPLLVLHGEQDQNVPASQAHAFHQTLERQGGPVEARFFPNGAHQLGNDAQRVAFEFLKRTLAP